MKLLFKLYSLSLSILRFVFTIRFIIASMRLICSIDMLCVRKRSAKFIAERVSLIGSMFIADLNSYSYFVLLFICNILWRGSRA